MKNALMSITLVVMTTSCFSQINEVIHLWPGKVPGEDSMKHAARVYPDTSKGVIRLTDVTDPLITVYAPKGVQKENQTPPLWLPLP